MPKGLGSFKSGLKYIRRSRFLSLACLFVLTSSFLVTLFFTFSFITSSLYFKALAHKAQISVYFKTTTGEPQILELKKQLESRPAVERVSYISQVEALKIYLGQHQNNPALLESVSSNILPASLEINTKDLSSLELLAAEFKQKEEVDEVVYFKEVVDSFSNLSLALQIIGFTLASLMILNSLFTVFLGVGISVKIRADEIETRRLVGATDSQVIAPFLWQGVIYGFVSSIISLVIFFIILLAASVIWRPVLASFLSQAGIAGAVIESRWLINVSSGYWLYTLTVVGQLIFGPLLGFVSSYLGVKKYLRL